MFEKEAKKWVKENIRIEHSASFGDIKVEPSAEKGFQKGAEFGYNKGKNEAIKHLRDLVYVVELGKNELATARIVAEAKKFLKETK